MNILDCIKFYHMWLIVNGDEYLAKEEVQEEILITMELIEKLGGQNYEETYGRT